MYIPLSVVLSLPSSGVGSKVSVGSATDSEIKNNKLIINTVFVY